MGLVGFMGFMGFVGLAGFRASEVDPGGGVTILLSGILGTIC